MFKKFIKFIFPLFVFLMLCPLKAHAATEYPLWVGNQQVTSENMSGKAGGGTWSFSKNWFSSGGTLTLDNATITTYYDNYDIVNNFLSNITIYDYDFDLTIKLIGQNSLSGGEYGIVTTSPLTIKGPGSLDIKTKRKGIMNYGANSPSSPLIIKGNSHIIITSEDDGINVAGGVEISDSIVDITSGESYSSIYAINKELTISDSCVITSGEIYSFDTLTISGNSLVISKNGIHTGYSGIVLEDNLKVLKPVGSKFNRYDQTILNSDGTKATNVMIGKEYDIKFVNYDGTVLQNSKFAYWQTPIYVGKTPTKPSDKKGSYVFAGWKPKITTVTGNKTYKATYNLVANTDHFESESNSDNISELTDDSENTDNLEALNAPNTGDQSGLLLWIALISLSFTDLVYTFLLGKSRRLKVK